MKKTALTAAMVLAATTLTGAAALPAAGDATVYTKRLVSLDIESHSLGPHTFAGAGVDRHAGHVIGYDAFTGHFYPKQERADIWVSYALRDGTISAVVHAHASATVNTGQILNGTGRYRGVRGTISARPAPHNEEKTFVTLTYHF